MTSLRDSIYSSPVMASRLKRYHAWPVLHEQTIGEHCARVANIYVEVFGLPRAEVLYYVLNHDAGELLAGDVPFGGKDHVPELRAAITEAERIGRDLLGISLPELTHEEQTCVKISDLLEMHEFGIIEELMGNTLAEPVTDETLRLAFDKASELHLFNTVYEWIISQKLRSRRRNETDIGKSATDRRDALQNEIRALGSSTRNSHGISGGMRDEIHNASQK